MAAGAIVTLMIGGVAGMLLLLSGTYDTAATSQHFAITHRLLEAGLHYSVAAAAEDIVVPPLDGPGMVEQGAACYRDHCAQCHGAPGVAPGSAAQGQQPVATNLTQVAREWQLNELYHVTKKGVRMTGMPAWEFTMSEHSLWSTISFLKQLPDHDAASYAKVAAVVDACPAATELTDVPSEDYAKIVLRQYACHSCHVIEGVVGPKSHVGPPLTAWSQRRYIAGTLPNTPENLTRWIQHPQRLRPGTMMPDLRVPESHAQVMADYLFTLD
jgi:mono/diheme cytochrome c family protein